MGAGHFEDRMSEKANRARGAVEHRKCSKAAR